MLALAWLAAADGVAAPVPNRAVAGDWTTDGHNYAAQRFSPLERINESNVRKLGLDWYYDLDTLRGVEATPLAVGGVLYDISAWDITYAFDVRSGKLLWKYDPQVPKEWGRYACCEPVSRGLAWWEGHVIIATLDGRLISLDAGTGQPAWRQSGMARNCLPRTARYAMGNRLLEACRIYASWT